MDTKPPSGTSASDNTTFVWIILAAILVLGTLLAFGSLSLLDFNSQAQLQKTSQPAPAR
jgi:hypothetical protein